MERLLCSPEFGVRWGRHWLDVAGYAESDGGSGNDTRRPNAWHYRDYVFESFNQNKPIDQFLLEQLKHMFSMVSLLTCGPTCIVPHFIWRQIALRRYL